MDTIGPISDNAHFNRQYATHLKHLKLKGLQPKTMDAYARAIRRIGDYFSHDLDALSESQLTDYFSDLIKSHSWSAVKLDLYGLKFFTLHVLRQPWVMPHLIKPPKASRLPDIVTVEEVQALFAATRTLSYRVFFFTLYSLGLRLSEGLALTVRDIDAHRLRVHIRPMRHWPCCASSGWCIATPSCCFPTVKAAWLAPAVLPVPWTVVACKRPCTR